MDDDPRTHGPLSKAFSPPLSLHDITRRFGNFTALENVSLSTTQGRITALLGENGAGKTTLMRIAFGIIQPDSGWIERDGERVRFTSPSDAIAAGIGMVHQQFSLIPAMTVAENVALGGRGRYSFDRIASTLDRIADSTGLRLDPRSRVANLGSADRQKLEIIRTLAHNASVMILDEPTAVLTARDTGELFRQLRVFAEKGGAVVLITHKLRDAMEHADDVAVLRRGKLVLDAQMKDVTAASLAAAMIGESEDPSTTSGSRKTSTSVVARIETQSVDIEVFGGEILGVAALDGAATPVLRALAARHSLPETRTTAPESVGFVPENRGDEALIADFTLTENLALSKAATLPRIVDWSLLRDQTQQVVERFDVRTRSADASPRELSGGNQQRFVLGRELRENPQLLVLENPTQGLDISAAAFIHNQLRDARDRGAGVVIYSSDLDELADISDRVLVVSRHGVTPVAADRAAIGNALLGTQQADAG